MSAITADLSLTLVDVMMATLSVYAALMALQASIRAYRIVTNTLQ